MERMENRAGAAVLAFVVGLVLGVVGTFNHRGVIGVGAVQLPWGIVVSLLGVACFLVGIRLYSGSRWVTLAGAVGLLVPILVFSFEGPGGSVVIVADTRGRIWDFVPVLIAIAVLAWPRPSGSGPVRSPAPPTP